MAAAKLDADCTFVGKVGMDVFGRGVLKNLHEQGVDTTHCGATGKASSGVAPIFVDESQRNAIGIVNGANSLITEEGIDAADPMLKNGKVSSNNFPSDFSSLLPTRFVLFSWRFQLRYRSMLFLWGTSTD